MLLSLYTWDGTAINDGTNYVAVIPPSQTMPGANPNYIDLGTTWPFLAGKTLQGTTFVFQIVLKGTLHSQLETLKGMFTPGDFTYRKLVARDTADSNREWYVEGFPIMPPTLVESEGGTAVNIGLALKDPYWRENVQQTDTWSITASGQTRSLTVRGNDVALPILTITPTAGKGGGYAYKRATTLYNPGPRVFTDYPYRITLNTAALVADTTVSNQINNASGITAAALTIAIDTPVGGGLPTTGGLCYVDTEQIYYTSIAGGVMTIPAGGRGWGGTTAATHADNAVLKRSKCLANCNDLALSTDGNDTDRWIDAPNNTSTGIWFNLNLKAEIEMTISAAIANSSTPPATLVLANTTANKNAIKLLPKTGLLLIDSEIFEYTNVNVNTRTLTISARNSRGTSYAAHSAGATARWLEHDFWLMYGNSTSSAPAVDDTYKPAIDLTSTNTSWVYTTFGAQNGLRTGAWKGAVLQRPERDQNYLYFGTQCDLSADPITDMGARIAAYQSGGVWKGATCKMGWKLYLPAGYTSLTSASGYKYRYLAGWPAIAQLQKSVNGTVFTNISAITSPASVRTWETWSLGATALPTTQYYLRLFFSGSQAAGANAFSALELGAITVALDSNGVPVQVVQAESSNYTLGVTLTNNVTGEAMTINCQTALGVPITIDCEQQIAYRADGANMRAALEFSTKRTEWLTFTDGANVLQYDDAGTSGVTFASAWRGRNLV